MVGEQGMQMAAVQNHLDLLGEGKKDQKEEIEREGRQNHVQEGHLDAGVYWVYEVGVRNVEKRVMLVIDRKEIFVTYLEVLEDLEVAEDVAVVLPSAVRMVVLVEAYRSSPGEALIPQARSRSVAYLAAYRVAACLVVVVRLEGAYRSAVACQVAEEGVEEVRLDRVRKVSAVVVQVMEVRIVGQLHP
jgi:hypothetical protein